MKSQDIVVILKIHLWTDGTWTQPKIAQSVGMSQSETSMALKRCELSGLYNSSSGKTIQKSLLEFIIHGLKYAFPAELGPPDRGMPTAHSAPPLIDMIADDSEIFVWPYVNGTGRGITVNPLYKTVPAAAENDLRLYEVLALIDAIRVGRVRERKLAEELLIQRLGE